MENKKGKIKEVDKLNDFENVYQVFTEEPYNEKYTKAELQEIFEEYRQKGYMYGVYDEDKCLGLIALKERCSRGTPSRI